MKRDANIHHLVNLKNNKIKFMAKKSAELRFWIIFALPAPNKILLLLPEFMELWLIFRK